MGKDAISYFYLKSK